MTALASPSIRKLCGSSARWKDCGNWQISLASRFLKQSGLHIDWESRGSCKRFLCTQQGITKGWTANVVKQMCNKLLETDCSASNMKAMLQDFEDAEISPYDVKEVLKSLTDVRVAMQFFNWAKWKPGFVHDGQNYTLMIELLGKSGNLVAAKHLFQEMRRANCGADVSAVNSLIKNYGNANLYDEAFALFKEMGKLGWKPDCYTFVTMIDFLTTIGRHQDATEMFCLMKETAWKPSPYNFNSLINSFKRCGDLRSAMECFEEMKICSIPPTGVTYSSLIDMLGNKGKVKAALDLYRQYQASHLKPDLVVYNSIMHALGRSGRANEAEAVLLDIQTAGLVPDVFTYCILVSTRNKEGSPVRAQDWFDKMLGAGVKPNVAICNALIHTYLESHMLDSVETLLASMQSWGLTPTLQTYTYLLNYYKDCRKQHLKKIQDLMHKTGHRAHKHFGDLLSQSGKKNNLEVNAKSAFQELRLEHHNWTREFADCLIDCLHNQNSMVEAHCIWEAALASKLYPRGVWEKFRNCWYLWLLDMQVGTALVALNAALILCRDKMLKVDPIPLRVIIITNWGKSRNCQVSKAVKDTLKFLASPFQPQLSAGRFICKGDELENWLYQPHVEAELF
ncbi:hypothetical protein O6H91_17G056000 [Diphasiastrum complanatum]|uniref:Uncharacterized protein n=1 Tax=Diphasiastrum complanatum TaxID=34168 RepID=A0ACC2B719_DIPCM|nr:hypothetical protein O6H91_17G056000 [Diphasiastrum complanatum]